jgi:hypothetical protein
MDSTHRVHSTRVRWGSWHCGIVPVRGASLRDLIQGVALKNDVITAATIIEVFTKLS